MRPATRVVADPSVGAGALDRAVRDAGFEVTRRSTRRLAAPGMPRPTGGRTFDLAIVGGGSAAVAAAIHASDLGAKVAIIEKGTIGGTCVNVGCIPSKTLIRAADVLHRAYHHAFAGIRARPDKPDMGSLVAQKDELVAQMRQSKYTDVLASYEGVTLIRGTARLGSGGEVVVDGTPIQAGKAILATGGSPLAPSIPGLDRVAFLTSTEALALTELPKTMAVIGGGSVGLELAQLFARLGTRVTILEANSRLLSAEDTEVAEALAAYLKQEGLEIAVGVQIREVSGGPDLMRVDFEASGRSATVEVERLLVATGRRPNTKGLGLEDAGVRLGSKGEIIVDEHLETSRKGVYAAGDVTGEPAFVYVAAHAGNLAAENAILGNQRSYDLRVVPRVTFTDPAVGSVGLTEVEARARGADIAVSRLPLSYVPRALAARDTRGFVKLIADAKTNLLLGAHTLAPEAGETVMVPAMAIRFGIRMDEIGAMLHPYLTNAEALKLAALGFRKDVAKLSCCAG
jgi:mercuric reductase